MSNEDRAYEQGHSPAIDHCPNCGTTADCACAATCDHCHEVVDALAWVVSADGYDRWSLCPACTATLRASEAEARAEDRAYDPRGIADDHGDRVGA